MIGSSPNYTLYCDLMQVIEKQTTLPLQNVAATVAAVVTALFDNLSKQTNLGIGILTTVWASALIEAVFEMERQRRKETPDG